MPQEMLVLDLRDLVIYSRNRFGWFNIRRREEEEKKKRGKKKKREKEPNLGHSLSETRPRRVIIYLLRLGLFYVFDF